MYPVKSKNLASWKFGKRNNQYIPHVWFALTENDTSFTKTLFVFKKTESWMGIGWRLRFMPNEGRHLKGHVPQKTSKQTCYWIQSQSKKGDDN
ncbi:unnamed protein product, partial [Mesorhabditis spiculigera]